MLTQNDLKQIKKIIQPEFTKLDKKINSVDTKLTGKIDSVDKKVNKVYKTAQKIQKELKTIAFSYDLNYLNLKKRVDKIETRTSYIVS